MKQLEEICVPRSPGSCRAFVGRQSELQELKQAFERVSTGHCEVVSVDAPAGYGKTALVRHFCEAVRWDCGALVATQKCSLRRKTSPYSALTEAFEALIDLVLLGPLNVSQGIAGQLKKQPVRFAGLHCCGDSWLCQKRTGILLSIVPSLSALVGEGKHRESYSSHRGQINRRGSRLEVLSFAVEHFFRCFAGRQPVVLFLDDVQWCDPCTIPLLASVLNTPTLEHVLVVLAYRTGELRVGLETVARVTHLQLQCFSDDEIAELLFLINENVASFSDSVKAEKVAEMVACTKKCCNGCVPLLVARFVPHLAWQQDTLFFEDQPIMCEEDGLTEGGLSDAVNDSLMTLEAKMKRVFVFLSAGPYAFSLEELKDLMRSFVNGGVDAENVVRAGLQLKLLRDGPHGNYEWFHDRIKDAVHGSLSPTEARQVNLELGQGLLEAGVVASLNADHQYVEGITSLDRLYDALFHLNKDFTCMHQDPIESARRLAILNLTAGDQSLSQSSEVALTWYCSSLEALMVAVRGQPASFDPWAEKRWSRLTELAFTGYLSALKDMGRMFPDLDSHAATTTELRRRARDLPDIISDFDSVDPSMLFFYVYERIRSKERRARLVVMRLEQLTSTGQFTAAFQFAQGTLMDFDFDGFEIPPQLSDTSSVLPPEGADELARLVAHLHTCSDEALMSLPNVKGQGTAAAVMEILGAMLVPSFNQASNAIWVTVAGVVSLSLKEGYSSWSSVALSALSALLVVDGVLLDRVRQTTVLKEFSEEDAVQLSRRMGGIAVTLSSRLSRVDSIMPQVANIFYVGQVFDNETQIILLRDRVIAAAGDNHYLLNLAGLTQSFVNLARVTEGGPFPSKAEAVAQERAELEMCILESATQLWVRFWDAMKGQTISHTSLCYRPHEPPLFTVYPVVQHVEAGVIMLLAVVFNEVSTVTDLVGQTITQHPRGMTYLINTIPRSICLLRLMRQKKRDGTIPDIVQLTEDIVRRCSIANAAAHAPWYHLLLAEKAMAQLQVDHAAGKYEETRMCARRHGNVLVEALALEGSAVLLRECGEWQSARQQLQLAVQAYRRYGAVAKVQELETSRPLISRLGLLSDSERSRSALATHSSFSSIPELRSRSPHCVSVPAATSMDVAGLELKFARELSRTRDIAECCRGLLNLALESVEGTSGAIIRVGRENGMLSLQDADFPIELRMCDWQFKVRMQEQYEKRQEFCGQSLLLCKDVLPVELILGVVLRSTATLVTDIQTATLSSSYFQLCPWITSVYCLPLSAQGCDTVVVYLEKWGTSFNPVQICALERSTQQANIPYYVRNAALFGELQETNDKLRQAVSDQEKEREASKHKTEFLTTVSHEIRTPLNAIIGMAEVLKRTPLFSEQQEAVSTIWTSGQLLLSQVNNILDLSKIEAGMMEIIISTFNLIDVVEEVLDSVFPSAQEKGIEVSYHLPSSVPPVVQGDRQRLSQVFVNLLGNAVKFTKEGEVALIFSSQGVDVAGVCVIHFSVIDTGIGIEESCQERIFEAFLQGDPSVTRRYDGTGLGLPIARRLMSLMGGDLCLEYSNVVSGKSGTSFVGELTVTVPSVSTPVYDSIPLGRGSVLLYHDKPGPRDRLCSLLEGWGCEVLTVSTLAGVIDSVKRRSSTLDVILLCIGQSVVMAAVKCVTKIRMMSRSSSPSRILVACSATGATADRLYAAVDGHMRMPVRNRELFAGFAVRLGLRSPHKSPKLEIERVSAPSTTTPNFAMSILLVEDNMVNTNVVKKLLGLLGLRDVQTAENGLIAVEKVKQQSSLDIILMDLHMPVMDGFEATREILQYFAGRSRPWIIALTADVFVDSQEKCQQLGMDAYATKPLTLEALEQTLSKFVGRRKEPDL